MNMNIQELKRKRSSVLHQMQIMGIDTTDWKRVNELCLNKRIAGKLFHKLTYEELDAVLIKLRIIKRKNKAASVDSGRLSPVTNLKGSQPLSLIIN
jgi:hypothetical protein